MYEFLSTNLQLNHLDDDIVIVGYYNLYREDE